MFCEDVKMKVLKKIIKIAALLFLVMILGLAAIDIYMIKNRNWTQRKN